MTLRCVFWIAALSSSNQLRDERVICRGTFRVPFMRISTTILRHLSVPDLDDIRYLMLLTSR